MEGQKEMQYSLPEIAEFLREWLPSGYRDTKDIVMAEVRRALRWGLIETGLAEDHYADGVSRTTVPKSALDRAAAFLDEHPDADLAMFCLPRSLTLKEARNVLLSRAGIRCEDSYNYTKGNYDDPPEYRDWTTRFVDTTPARREGILARLLGLGGRGVRLILTSTDPSVLVEYSPVEDVDGAGYAEKTPSLDPMAWMGLLRTEIDRRLPILCREEVQDCTRLDAMSWGKYLELVSHTFGSPENQSDGWLPTKQGIVFPRYSLLHDRYSFLSVGLGCSQILTNRHHSYLDRGLKIPPEEEPKQCMKVCIDGWGWSYRQGLKCSDAPKIHSAFSV